ncbi:metallophosphoesterase [Paenibacillus sp. Leaf72]|uniref:metallophosphoesterase n=1 Tax=Paenibacillus sp. Leaf72 TaxID=1736234 RepID=UPI0006FAC851|nr:metallophosphoesterase [Paenibacillus sp. Leaf72]KQO18243.1 phosphoesterase [Paenibacillus sp. Leaf72]
MFIVMGIVMLAVFGSLVFYQSWSIWRWLKPLHTGARKLIYTVVAAALPCTFIIAMITQNAILIAIGMYWLAIFCLLLLIIPSVQLIARLLRFTSLPRESVSKWSGIAVPVLLLALLGYGSFLAYSPVVRTYDITIPKGAQDGDSAKNTLKIVMASDMHFGILSGKDHAVRLVERINALKPDIVLFPGDILDDQIQPYLDHGIDKVMATIEAPYGVYASLGNHDKYNGHIEDIINAVEAGGMKVLYDESVTIDDRFTLLGRKDHSDTERAPLSELVQGMDAAKPLILLEHQPYDFDIADELGIDLMLSGHTHHGQIFPANFITQLVFENDWGYLKKEQLQSIVSSGFGFWGPPIRLGSRSEIVEINVTFSSPGAE